MTPIEQWIQDHGITFAIVQRVPENPNMATDEWSKSAYHYWLAIDNPAALGEPFQTYYSVGSGIIANWAIDKRRFGNEGGAPPYKPNTVAYVEAIEREAKRFKPALADIMESLAMDSRFIDGVDCFEDWAAELGYDEDSRKALATYETVRNQGRALRLWLERADPDGFTALLTALEKQESE